MTLLKLWVVASHLHWLPLDLPLDGIVRVNARC
jgi:hypothetical protein